MSICGFFRVSVLILGGYLCLVLFQLIIRLILRERAGILAPSCVDSRLFVTVYNYIILYHHIVITFVHIRFCYDNEKENKKLVSYRV